MTYFISHPTFALHLTGSGHPEQPARSLIVDRALELTGLKTDANTLTPRAAEESDILLCHTQSYYQMVCREVAELPPKTISTLSTGGGDVKISNDSLKAALLAAGGVLTAIDKVMSTPGSNAFCVVRPPGHHACSAEGMGFCFFNNVAIGARYAQKKYGVKRVLIADWDVHHGNGIQEIFYSDPTVFYFSTHEKGIYPWTGTPEEIGEGQGKGFNLNCPILPGLHSRVDVINAFQIQLREAMKSFQPDLVLVSAGFDAHAADPLGHFNLTDQDFATLTQIIMDIAQEYAQGRVVSVLEGGYNLQALASSAVSHAKTLNDKRQ